MEMQMLGGEQVESWQQLCQRVGNYLGLEGPAPDAVVQRALDDPIYARNLQICRNQSQMLALLFDEAMKGGSMKDTVNLHPAHGTGDLVLRAAKAFASWARSGFDTVDDATYQKRLQACQRCPHLRESPDHTLYRLMQNGVMQSGERRQTICGLCGCVTARKAKLATESCPGEDPSQPGRNRWGQLLTNH
jgi:hypothetical protein